MLNSCKNPRVLRKLSPTAELILVNALCFGAPIALSAWFAIQRTRHFVFDDRTMLAIVGFEVVAGALAAGLLISRGWKWSDLTRPFSQLDPLVGSFLFLAYVLIVTTMFAAGVAISGRELATWVTYDVNVSWFVVALVALVNPLFEELFEVAYNITALRKSGPAFAITFSTAVRFCTHLNQGPMAALTLIPLGLIFGAFYWYTRRLWPLVVSHVFDDVLSLGFSQQ